MKYGFERGANDEILVTTDATNAQFRNGFLRAPTGEVVVTTDNTGSEFRNGFLRAPNGALVMVDATPDYVRNGLGRRLSDGALAVTQSVTDVDWRGGWRVNTTTYAMHVSGLALSYAEVVLADDPALFWRLGESAGATANDETANNRDGTYTGGVTLGVAGLLAGDPDTAASFDGTTGWVASVYSPAASPQVTLEGWAVRDTSTSADVLVGSASSPFGVRFQISSGNNNVTFEPQFGFSGGTWVNAWPGNGIVTHWVLTFNQATDITELYINGVSKGTQPATTDFHASAPALHLGASGGGDPFDGTLDEFAVYLSILPPERVTAHFEAGT